MKNLLIEDAVLAQILKEAVDSGDYITCERCGLLVPAADMFHSVCRDCATELVEDGLERERQEIEKAEIEEAMLEKFLEDIAMQCLAKDGIPVGAVDLDIFLI